MARLGSLDVMHCQDPEPAQIEKKPSTHYSHILSAEGATAHVSGQRLLFGRPLCTAFLGLLSYIPTLGSVLCILLGLQETALGS